MDLIEQGSEQKLFLALSEHNYVWFVSWAPNTLGHLSFPFICLFAYIQAHLYWSLKYRIGLLAAVSKTLPWQQIFLPFLSYIYYYYIKIRSNWERRRYCVKQKEKKKSYIGNNFFPTSLLRVEIHRLLVFMINNQSSFCTKTTFFLDGTPHKVSCYGECVFLVSKKLQIKSSFNIPLQFIW